MAFKFGKISLKRLETTEPFVQEIMHEVLSKSPYDFGIPEFGGRRTIEHQEHLVKQGKSKTMNSKHLKGEAIDICRYMGGDEYSFEREHILPIAHIVKQVAKDKGYKVIWGGDWLNFVDAPHFEFTKKERKLVDYFNFLKRNRLWEK